MEGRPSLHYKGNTVELPHPGRKRLKKNAAVRFGSVVPTARRIEYDRKVCAAYTCVWCSYTGDSPMIICIRCRNCQYCGQCQGSGYDHECVRCGNFIPTNFIY